MEISQGHWGQEEKNEAFNTEGQCEPEIHYMVRLDERLKRIKDQFIDRGKFFYQGIYQNVCGGGS